MNDEKISLHALVDKWLAPTADAPARVIRIGRVAATGRRYVCVEGPASRGPLALFLFRHDDGCWRVFPPTDTRPVMRQAFALAC
ncbi:hypothetical protein WKR88_17620 [Trinickia caryophylli]|uniref:Uncharacterized protein n=1 Tax=Trinickia caryophylli TaxID=28094 RepID=A0A1X7DX50_TRICW|nr:hypothetical protein [Trinickia caryophylli]PMS14186.1 hypothetical protein C0Z17_01230 [Trinickia caryophylli]TRX17885.1 hypothetical protein FNF07_06365 [Trinickia caryophylli]WQE11345.1 hypothetical protein U0034_16560 [Trinickia caryophylli]SMF23434.1 hypothetical protein SAMN06295900_104192 [Trinickia caryophylli]GLU32501.1 hypothetical protein Busp01_23430 [Trinickia caryophylli]